MITTQHPIEAAAISATEELPPGTAVERFTLPDGNLFEMASIAIPSVEPATHDAVIAELVSRATAWSAAAGGQPVVVPLYGMHVVWSARRSVALAAADRLPAMRTAVVEFCHYEAELRDIERRVADALGHVDADAPLAFEFDERSLPRRRDLAARFREAISLSRRLGVVAPLLQRPAPQPPTLAGQVGERLRERARVADRLEHADDQVDLLERVYTGCGERISDFVASRRHLVLEWVIMLLLAVEVVLLTVTLLATSTQ